MQVSTLGVPTDVPLVKKASKEDICMSNALHYEARSEGLRGMRAVYDSIKYRASKRGLSICRTISQKRQYSFLNNGRKMLYDEKMLTTLRAVVSMRTVVHKADFFFATGSKRPYWADKFKFVGEFYGHKFYRS